MSYDLFMSSRKMTLVAFEEFFRTRNNYAEPGQYFNSDTGVYFRFDFLAEGVEKNGAEEEKVVKLARVSFNLNYFRPHVFGLEAEPEVRAFIAEFECSIRDPQLDGMGEGPYSSEGFLRGWNAGNAFGYQAVCQHGHPENILVADDGWIESVWRWNLLRHALANYLGGKYAIPKVTWTQTLENASPIAFGVWSEGELTALPECASHALLVRPVREDPSSGLEFKFVEIESIAKLPGCSWHNSPAGRVLLAPETVPPSPKVLEAFDGKFHDLAELSRPVSGDRVRNASIMKTVGS